jgi:hypothetical protein
VLFLVSKAEGDVCRADAECEGFWRGCAKGIEGLVIRIAYWISRIVRSSRRRICFEIILILYLLMSASEEYLSGYLLFIRRCEL